MDTRAQRGNFCNVSHMLLNEFLRNRRAQRGKFFNMSSIFFIISYLKARKSLCRGNPDLGHVKSLCRENPDRGGAKSLRRENPHRAKRFGGNRPMIALPIVSLPTSRRGSIAYVLFENPPIVDFQIGNDQHSADGAHSLL